MAKTRSRTRPKTRPDGDSDLDGAEIVEKCPGEAPIIVTGSREQLFHLLAEASEIEHCLMCSYLYAAFSLRRKAGDGLTTVQLKTVERWRKAILGVAIEEMGHLLILANLSAAIGGRPHFSRPNFPVAPGYFPSGVVVRLSGFSPETLDHFIYLERPREVADDEADPYAQEDYSRRQAHLGLMPNAQHYSTIGFLYEAIRENLTGLADRLGEDTLFLAAGAPQLVPPTVDLPGIARITGLQTALAGIDLIVEQGEGSPSDRDGTHYRTFRAMREEYRRIVRRDPAFAPAWPVADNPVLRSPPDPEDKLFVDHPEAAALLDLGCAVYGLLLRVLAHCFTGPGKADPGRAHRFGLAVELMHVMGDCASTLAELPAARDGGPHAGLSFTMLRNVEPFRDGPAGETLIAEQIGRLVEGAAGVEALPTAIRRRIEGLKA